MPTAGTGYDADYTAEVQGAVDPSGWCDGVLRWVHLGTPMAFCPESPQQLVPRTQGPGLMGSPLYPCASTGPGGPINIFQMN